MLFRSTLLSFGLLVSVGAGAELQRLSGDPVAARDFDYCAWIRQADFEQLTLPDFTQLSQVAKEAGNERELAALLLLDAGIKVARASANPNICRKEFKQGRKLFKKTLKKNTRKLSRQAKFKAVDDLAIAAAQAAISEHWLRDQAGRFSYVALDTELQQGSRFWARRLAAAELTLLDSAATAYMKQLLQDYDWIDRTRFGAQVSKHAWLLVQHADDHPDFQALVLERMKPYLENGGILPKNYAYLWDRVAVNHGRLQRYGTQPVWECKDGVLELQPLEDPETVDLRRARMGMKSVAEGLAEMARGVCLQTDGGG